MALFSEHTFFSNAQNTLYAGSWFPIPGVSFISSTVQALLSTAELIVGVIGAGGFWVASMVTKGELNAKCMKHLDSAQNFTKEGAVYLACSIFNMATAGFGIFTATCIIGCISECLKNKRTEENPSDKEERLAKIVRGNIDSWSV